MSHRTIRSTSGAVLIPGIGGSGTEHWQTRWQEENPDLARISPRSWDEPDLEDWIAALDRAAGDRLPVLVAHSLGCLLAIEGVRRNPACAAGLFLVALPDPAAPTFPLPESPFSAIDLSGSLPVPTLIVASDDDDYCGTLRSIEIAHDLGAGWVSPGALGHINADSGLGRWREGQDLLVAFEAGIGIRRDPRG